MPISVIPRRLLYILTVLTVTGFSVLTTTGRLVNTASAQNLTPSNPAPPSPENNYYFTQPTPSGNWVFRTADYDTRQNDDLSIPVTIVGMSMYTGKSEWKKHLMINSIVLKNRINRPVADFRLGWIIMTIEDQQAGKNREAALLDGFTELIDPHLKSLEGRTSPFYLEVLKIARPLLKNGELNGTFAFRVRLTEVRFQDGSVWTDL